MTSTRDNDMRQSETVGPNGETVGRLIRMRRQIKRMTLQAVADRAGISIGLLSQVERDATAPSLRSLGQICAALEMPMSWLFSASGEQGSAVVTRAVARRRFDLGPKGMSKELMTPDAVSEIQMMRIVIQPGGSSGDQPYNSASGAKCGTVLEGSLGIEVDGRTYVVGPGDSFAFKATEMHRFWCEGNTSVDLIWVVTPAVY